LHYPNLRFDVLSQEHRSVTRPGSSKRTRRKVRGFRSPDGISDRQRILLCKWANLPVAAGESLKRRSPGCAAFRLEPDQPAACRRDSNRPATIVAV